MLVFIIYPYVSYRKKKSVVCTQWIEVGRMLPRDHMGNIQVSGFWNLTGGCKTIITVETTNYTNVTIYIYVEIERDLSASIGGYL